jgi:hypothetical protein
VRGVNTPEMKDAFMKPGLELQTGTPEQFGAFIRTEIVQNAKTAKFARDPGRMTEKGSTNE